MELRIAAIIGIIAASLQLLLHVGYVLVRIVGSRGGSPVAIYNVLEVIGLLPSIGYLACFVFFLIGFNKLLAPASPQSPS